MTTMTIKNLGVGQLANSIGDIYTVAASTQAIVKSIVLVNGNTTTEAVNLYYLKASGTARMLIPKDCALAAGASLEFDTVITLGAGDKIQGNTTTASKVDYIISGVEESA